MHWRGLVGGSWLCEEVRLLEHEYAILQGLSLSGVLGVSALLRSDQG